MSIKFVVVFLAAIVTTLGCGKRHTPEETLAKVTLATGNVVSIRVISTETYNDEQVGMLCRRSSDFGARPNLLDRVGDRTYGGVFEVKGTTYCHVSLDGVQRLTVTYMGADREGSKKLMTQEIVRGKESYDFTVGLHEEPVIIVSPRQSSDPPLLPAPIGSGAK